MMDERPRPISCLSRADVRKAERLGITQIEYRRLKLSAAKPGGRIARRKLGIRKWPR